jgi:hypothetical protein
MAHKKMSTTRPTTVPIRATDSIPWIPRLCLTTFEPLVAVSGAIQVITQPQVYIAILTRTATSDIHPAALGNTWIYTQLAGGWLIIAFLEAVLLRVVDDLRVWKLVCMAVLLSDVCYVLSAVEAAGGWTEHFAWWKWTVMDLTAQITTWPFVLSRIGVLTGLLVMEKNKSS